MQKRAEYSKAYYLKNKQQILARSKSRYYAKRDEILDQHADYHKRYVLTLDGRFFTSRQTAKCKGREWTISKEEYAALVSRTCFYCGKINTRTRGSGLDRIDSKKGYVQGNVCSCCYKCNQAKSNLSVTEFYAHVNDMYKTISRTIAEGQ